MRPDKELAAKHSIPPALRRYAVRHGASVEEIVQTHKKHPAGMLDHWADKIDAAAAEHRFEMTLVGR